MQGADMAQHAHIYNEIMLPYAGIIRIRFMGMISARNTPDTPAIVISGANVQNLLNIQTKTLSRNLAVRMAQFVTLSGESKLKDHELEKENKR